MIISISTFSITEKKMDLHVHSDTDMCVAAALQMEGACC